MTTGMSGMSAKNAIKVTYVSSAVSVRNCICVWNVLNLSAVSIGVIMMTASCDIMCFGRVV